MSNTPAAGNDATNPSGGVQTTNAGGFHVAAPGTVQYQAAPGQYPPPPGPPSGQQGYHYGPLPEAPATHYQGYPLPPGPPPSGSHNPGYTPHYSPHGPGLPNTYHQYPTPQVAAPAGTLFYVGVTVPDPFIPQPLSVEGWDARGSFEAFRKATKGFGANDAALISTLVPLNPIQMQVLSTMYAQQTGKDLLQTLDKESSGSFKSGIRSLALGPLAYDCELVKKAIAGIGTNEAILTEVLLGRSREDLALLMRGYQHFHGQDLKDAVKKDLSGKTERLFTIALTATPPPDNANIDYNQVAADVEDLYKAGQGKSGTDEMVFCQILANRSKSHLTAICDLYGQKYKSLTKIIKSEFSGHMRDSLLYIVKGVKSKRKAFGDGVWRDAKLLEAAMAGFGTNDAMLIARIVRAHWDKERLKKVKEAYQTRYKKTLESRVSGETSGAYKKLMIALLDI